MPEFAKSSLSQADYDRFEDEVMAFYKDPDLTEAQLEDKLKAYPHQEVVKDVEAMMITAFAPRGKQADSQPAPNS